MTALYAESGRHSNGYSRLATDPGGPNQIVMFKSCFPNSVLRDDGAPVPAIADNPLKGLAWGGGPGWEAYTIANAKGIYLDLLEYFGAHPEKLFVAVVAPPVVDQDTRDGRKLANWLVDHWLQDAGYSVGNVLVFDLYNVLTSKTGGGASDVGLASGNHHRLWNGAVQHKTDDGADRLAYPAAPNDSHPNAAGLRKATAEFVPLLNAAYNAWRGAAAERGLQRVEGRQLTAVRPRVLPRPRLHRVLAAARRGDISSPRYRGRGVLTELTTHHREGSV